MEYKCFNLDVYKNNMYLINKIFSFTERVDHLDDIYHRLVLEFDIKNEELDMLKKCEIIDIYCTQFNIYFIDMLNWFTELIASEPYGIDVNEVYNECKNIVNTLDNFVSSFVIYMTTELLNMFLITKEDDFYNE